MMRKVLMLVVMVSSLVGLVMAQGVDRFAGIKTIRTISAEGVKSLQFSSDGETLIGIGFESIFLWNTSDGKLIGKYGKNEGMILYKEISPNGLWVSFRASKSKDYWLFNVQSKKIYKTFSDDSLYGFGFSIDDKYLYGFSSSWRSLNYVFNINESKIEKSEPAQALKFLKYFNGYVIYNYYDNRINSLSVRKFSDNSIISGFKESEEQISSISFHLEEKLIAIASEDNSVKIWNYFTGKLLHRLDGHKFWATDAKFGPKGDILASSSNDRTVKIWDVFSGALLTTLTGHKKSVHSVAFSPDGRMIASASDDGTIRFWEVSDGSPIFGASLAWLEKYGQTTTPKNGSLELRSNNEGATLTVNGEDKGLTGASRSLELPAGTYTVTVSASNFKPQTQTITIESGKTANAVFNLEWQDSTLNVRSNNEGANISINGEVKGVTGATRDFKLQPGTYSVQVSAPGFKTQTQTVVIVGGRNANVVFNLERELVAAPEPKPVEATPASTPTPSSTTTSSTPPRTSVVSGAPRSNVRTLVIGIGTYGEDRIPKLEYAESDAKKFEAALKDPKVGNISGENVTSLIGSQATKTRIEARVKSLAGQTLSGETLIVYFSGHGTPSAKGEPWLVPWDADPNDLPSSVIGLRDLQSTRTAGGNLVLILDSCFSGDAKGKSFVAPGAKPFGIVVKAPTVTGNVSVLSASGSDQSSFEGSSVGGSYLTHFLIEGMNGGAADLNGDGVVSLEEAFKYAKPKVEATARARNSARQTPQLTGAGDVTLAVNVRAVSDARAGKLSALLAADKISPEQFEKLLEQVNVGQESPTLKSFLDGSISEATFLAALKNGAVPGVPKR
jgi:WD40 repeat protein